MKLLEKLLLGTDLPSEQGIFPGSIKTCLKKHCTSECIKKKHYEWEFFALFLANKGTKNELIANLKKLHNDLRIAIYQKCVPTNRYLKFNVVFKDFQSEVADYIIKSCYDVGDNDVIFNIYMNIVEDLKENEQCLRNVIKRDKELVLHTSSKIKNKEKRVDKRDTKKIIISEIVDENSFKSEDPKVVDYKILIPAIKKIYSISYDQHATYKLIYVLVFESRFFDSYSSFYKLFISYLVRKDAFFKFLDVLFATNCTAHKLFTMIVEDIWDIGSKEHEYIFYDQYNDTVEIKVDENNCKDKEISDKIKTSLNAIDTAGQSGKNMTNTQNVNKKKVEDVHKQKNLSGADFKGIHAEDTIPTKKDTVDKIMAKTSICGTKSSLETIINSSVKKAPNIHKFKEILFYILDKILMYIDLSLLSKTEKLRSLIKPETPKISGKTKETFFDFLVIQNKTIEAQENIKNSLLCEIYKLRSEISNLRKQNDNLKKENKNLEAELDNFQNGVTRRMKEIIENEKNENEKLKREIEILKNNKDKFKN